MKRRDAIKTIGGLAGAAAMSRVPARVRRRRQRPRRHHDVRLHDDGEPQLRSLLRLAPAARGHGRRRPGRRHVEPEPRRQLDVPIVAVGADAITMCDLDPPHGWDRAARVSGTTARATASSSRTRRSTTTDAIEPMQYLTREQLPVSYALADAYTTVRSLVLLGDGPDLAEPRSTGTRHVVRRSWTTMLPSTACSWPIDLPPARRQGRRLGLLLRLDRRSSPLIDDIDVRRPNIRRFERLRWPTPRPASCRRSSTSIRRSTLNDDHPPIHPINGQELIAAVYTALASSPQWKNIMFVITYDENGGFFDHVSPPTTADDSRRRRLRPARLPRADDGDRPVREAELRQSSVQLRPHVGAQAPRERVRARAADDARSPRRTTSPTASTWTRWPRTRGSRRSTSRW